MDIDRDKLILIQVDKWQTGIAGIVASGCGPVRPAQHRRLLCRRRRPRIGPQRGGFNLFQALEDDRDLLSSGGHPLAAGFAVEQAKYETLAQRRGEKAQRA